MADKQEALFQKLSRFFSPAFEQEETLKYMSSDAFEQVLLKSVKPLIDQKSKEYVEALDDFAAKERRRIYQELLPQITAKLRQDQSLRDRAVAMLVMNSKIPPPQQAKKAPYQPPKKRQKGVTLRIKKGKFE